MPPALRLTDITSLSRDLAATASRSAKIATLAALLSRAAPEEIAALTAFLTGRLRQGKVGLGPALVRDASRTTHAREATLTLGEVDAIFERAAGASGPGSTRERARLLEELFARATEAEADFLIRLVHGELRQGAQEGIMEEALAQASQIPVEDIRRAVMVAGDLDAVAHAVLTEGRAGLGRFRIQIFRPLAPMLAQPAEDIAAALDRHGEALFETKLDGARIQVHKSDDEVRVYSRSLHDITAAVPEVVEVVRVLPARTLILDGEALALRPDGRPHPFQITMRRLGRKLDVERLRSELPLTPYFFDLLALEGEDLVDRPARERAARLQEAVREHAVPRLLTADAGAARAFLDQVLERGHEGLMAKGPESRYEAGRRGASWLKIKVEHTLDLVVLAAEWGHGRRSGWLSNLHLGARDPATGSFVMLGKTFKGMTDEILAWQTAKLTELQVATDGWTVHVRPELVVEIAFNDVQQSPHYPGGMALRFARLRRYRTDKAAVEADTLETVRAIHEGRDR